MGATISLCRHFQGRLLLLSSGRQAFLMPDRLVVDAQAILAPASRWADDEGSDQSITPHECWEEWTPGPVLWTIYDAQLHIGE